ncbi:MAG: DUF4962 domain-containing protein [Acidobacteriota bacterium]
MPTTRRVFLRAVPAAPLAWAPAAAAAFPDRQPARALFAQPPERAAASINPPGFAWWRAQGASTYRLLVRNAAGKTVYEAADLTDPVHLPARTLEPGDYRWDVEACDPSGTVLARRGEWRFRVPKGLPELPWEDPKAILARVPDTHPRHVFLKDELPRLRQSLSSSRRLVWEAVKRAADRALHLPLPNPPQYHTFEGKVRQRMGYTVYFRDFRGSIDGGMSVLALAYLLSGQEHYGLAAKKLLLEVERWGVEGPMSVLSEFGDEPGLSMARHGQRAYDWLYDLFDEGERARVRELTAARARQVLRRLRRADYLASPAESHNGRLIAYLSEYAVVLKGEAPDAAEWLDYSLRALTTFYPHWGDTDGGWAEGVSYALSYNTLYLPAIEALRAAAGVDLYRRPFFNNVRKYFLYCTSPKGEIRPFGDGADRPASGPAGAVLMAHHGRRLRDAASVWWAEQAGGLREGLSDPLVAVMTEDAVPPQPPSDLPTAAVFRGIGWAALHSALDKPDEDTFFLLKSSPYGSVSHSHADQNSFAILKGGRALAIPSGYYGPAYGMPHHADWTRQTKANNCVLVNGEGQVVREHTAAGRITQFRHQQALTYVCGDAAPAYGGKLTSFLRHVLFVRPGVFALLDELAAPAPAEFAWLLHAFERMKLDEQAATVVSARKGASLTVRLACEGGLAFRQTDVFDTPYNAGNPPEYHEQRENQWHFAAATRQRAARVRIAALMVVRDERETLATVWKEHKGWAGVTIETPSGKGEAWIQVTPAAPGPPGFPAAVRQGRALAAARWNKEELIVE